MRELQTLAEQSGLISRTQALERGLSPSAITRRLASGEWKLVLPGVYRHVASPVSDLLMVHAAQLWLGTDAVLWGTWAAWWHDMRPEPHGPVAMTVPRSRNGRSHAYVRVRRRDLKPREATNVRGVLVTTRAVTALENAGLPDGQFTFDRALQRHVAVSDLESAVPDLWHAYGVVAAKESLTLATDGTVSHPERVLAAALRRAGLTQIKAGARVTVGGSMYWLDFSVEAIKLVIEVDGHRAHTDPATFEKDRVRQNALVLDHWTMLRYTRWQIRNDLSSVVSEIAHTCLVLA